MQIANPIYDSVFKYLLEDRESAVLFLSALLEVEVLELEFLPQEHTVDVQINRVKTTPPTSHELTTFRMDFAAKVNSKSRGVEVILIELQKARMLSDTMRFRSYIGKQYLNENNTLDKIKENGKFVRNPLPLKFVYFLGGGLDTISGEPVVHVERVLRRSSDKSIIETKDTFIDCVSHDCIIVVIPELTGHQSNELEKMLQIFDQNTVNETGHLLDLNENAYPAKYEPLVRRLHKASKDAETRQKMEGEDFILNEMKMWEKSDQMKEAVIMEERRQKEEERRQKEEERRQKEEERRQKEETVSFLAILIRKQMAEGISLNEIALNLGVSEEKIQQLLGS